MVSSARNAPSSITVNLGVSNTVEISVPRPTLAPSSRSQHRGQQAGVEREQVVARGVHQPLGRPQLPARRGCAPGDSPRAARCDSSRTADHRQQRVHREPRPVPPPASTASAGSTACDSRWVWRTATAITARPAASAISGSAAEQHRRQPVHRRPSAVPAGRPLVGPRVAGLAGLHRGRALPVLAVLDLADHAGAGRHVGVLADHRAGQQGGAGADRSRRRRW